MGEPGVPSNEEREGRRVRAVAIVDSVRNDTEMLPTFERHGQCFLVSAKLVEQLVFDLAQEICMLQDQLRFIDATALTAVQSIVSADLRIHLLWKIKASCRGELPESVER